MNHFGQTFPFFQLAVIFSKFLDGIKENAPKHQTRLQIFINSRTCSMSGIPLLAYILKPSSNRSPYIFTLVKKVKHRVHKIYAFF